MEFLDIYGPTIMGSILLILGFAIIFLTKRSKISNTHFCNSCGQEVPEYFFSKDKGVCLSCAMKTQREATA